MHKEIPAVSYLRNPRPADDCSSCSKSLVQDLGAHADHWPPSYSPALDWGLRPHAHRLVKVSTRACMRRRQSCTGVAVSGADPSCSAGAARQGRRMDGRGARRDACVEMPGLGVRDAADGARALAPPRRRRALGLLKTERRDQDGGTTIITQRRSLTSPSSASCGSPSCACTCSPWRAGCRPGRSPARRGSACSGCR